jgi:glutamate 5-kinase
MRPGKGIVVVKYGSTSVADEQGMDSDKLWTYSNQIQRLSEFYDVVVVSSGAIATGRAIAREMDLVTDDQNCAALGADEAFYAWKKVFKSQDKAAGMVSVTNHEIDTPEGEILRRRIFSMLDVSMIPVVNGNDVLSDEGSKELRIDTDNDRLAAHLAKLLRARYLLMMTDRPGVLSPQDELVRCVGIYNIEKVLSYVRKGQEGDGRGGIRSKINEAYNFSHRRLGTGLSGWAYIAKAGEELTDVIDGRVGTYFGPQA